MYFTDAMITYLPNDSTLFLNLLADKELGISTASYPCTREGIERLAKRNNITLHDFYKACYESAKKQEYLDITDKLDLNTVFEAKHTDIALIYVSACDHNPAKVFTLTFTDYKRDLLTALLNESPKVNQEKLLAICKYSLAGEVYDNYIADISKYRQARNIYKVNEDLDFLSLDNKLREYGFKYLKIGKEKFERTYYTFISDNSSKVVLVIGPLNKYVASFTVDEFLNEELSKYFNTFNLRDVPIYTTLNKLDLAELLDDLYKDNVIVKA